MIHSERLARLDGVSHLLRPDYAQRFLLPPALDEWVPADHPVRFVRDFVDSLDLRTLGIEASVGDEGRPAYAPDLLLKVWLFGYMERIRSTRGLEKACLQVMPFLWLTGNLHPDHNTLWRFFKTHRAALPKLFKQLVKMAAEAELIGFVLHALDGTKLTAVSSTDGGLHRKGLEEKLKRIDEHITAYMKEVTTQSDDAKGAGYDARRDDEPRRAPGEDSCAPGAAHRGPRGRGDARRPVGAAVARGGDAARRQGVATRWQCSTGGVADDARRSCAARGADREAGAQGQAREAR